MLVLQLKWQNRIMTLSTLHKKMTSFFEKLKLVFMTRIVQFWLRHQGPVSYLKTEDILSISAYGLKLA